MIPRTRTSRRRLSHIYGPFTDRCGNPFALMRRSDDGVDALRGGPVRVHDDHLRGAGRFLSFLGPAQLAFDLIVEAAAHDELGVKISQRH